MTARRATSSGWQIPKALPDLRRVNIVALDIETNDEGLRDDRGSAWPWRGGHVCGINVAYRADGDIRAHYFPLCHPDTDNFDPRRVLAWLEDLTASGVRLVRFGARGQVRNGSHLVESRCAMIIPRQEDWA